MASDQAARVQIYLDARSASMARHPAAAASPEGLRVLRHRPLTVEAIQVTVSNRQDVALWCGGVPINRGIGLYTDTHDLAHAAVGDWIIKGPFGDFYPEPDRVVFTKYEAVVPLVSE